MVRSRGPGSARSPRPKRRRAAWPIHHSTMVSSDHQISGVRSCSPDPSAFSPWARHAISARDRPAIAAENSGPTRRQVSGDSGDRPRCSRVCSMTSLRILVSRSSSWSARAITTSHCLMRPSLMAACSVRRSRSAFTASVSGGWSAGVLSGSTLGSRGASSLRVSARSLRAIWAAAMAAARTPPASSRSPSISTASTSAWPVRSAMRSSWRVQVSISCENGRWLVDVDGLWAQADEGAGDRTGDSRLQRLASSAPVSKAWQTRRMSPRIVISLPWRRVGLNPSAGQGNCRPVVLRTRCMTGR